MIDTFMSIYILWQALFVAFMFFVGPETIDWILDSMLHE